MMERERVQKGTRESRIDGEKPIKNGHFRFAFLSDRDVPIFACLVLRNAKLLWWLGGVVAGAWI